MMTSAERAKEQLTLTPKAEFSLENDGFIGALYRPEKDEYPGKAVIMFGGSDGIYNLTKLVAEQYVNPETEGCAGYHSFGFNRNEQLARIILFPFLAALLVWICTLL